MRGHAGVAAACRRAHAQPGDSRRTHRRRRPPGGRAAHDPGASGSRRRRRLHAAARTARPQAFHARRHVEPAPAHRARSASARAGRARDRHVPRHRRDTPHVVVTSAERRGRGRTCSIARIHRPRWTRLNLQPPPDRRRTHHSGCVHLHSRGAARAVLRPLPGREPSAAAAARLRATTARSVSAAGPRTCHRHACPCPALTEGRSLRVDEPRIETTAPRPAPVPGRRDPGLRGPDGRRNRASRHAVRTGGVRSSPRRLLADPMKRISRRLALTRPIRHGGTAGRRATALDRLLLDPVSWPSPGAFLALLVPRTSAAPSVSQG